MYGLFTDSRTGLSNKFEKFRQNIELTENQKQKIISSHTHLRQNYLQRLPYISETFLTGSYKKSTMIRPPSDVDVFLITNQKKTDTTPNTILNKLKKDLSSLYPSTNVRQDRPCIVLDFNHCQFELTPVVKETVLWDDYFFIPLNGGNSWTEVEDPRKLEKRLSNANRNLDGKLTPLIKMMKVWKKNNNIRNIKSFEIEEKTINNISHMKDYRDGVQQLLKIFGWKDSQGFFSSRVDDMDDYVFARYCRNTLFGSDFPE
ncbi:SMODS domain-containing nucleotidyltransferase [Microbulbifer sp. JMSA004]|uniref:SMODS domain-containing nucleotidyltransferase n=1 Tax=Microbulbifer sp. JMSA004 TaxID=3243370 RepID=UPI00403954B1